MRRLRLAVAVVALAFVTLGTVLTIAQQIADDQQSGSATAPAADPINNHEFSDVPTGSIYHSFVSWLVARGITGGCGAGVFCPDQPVTRAQMAVFLKQNSLTGSPLAFGTIAADGTISSGSGNFTASYDAASTRYVITITGHSYFFSSYTTQLTLISSTCAGYGIASSSVGGSLLVYIHDPANLPAQCPSGFQFTTFFNGN